MRFQQDGKIYDTEKSKLIFEYRQKDHNERPTTYGYYRTAGDQYFVAFWMKKRKLTWWQMLIPGYPDESVPWGHRVTLREIQCKAFDLGLDLEKLGLEPLPEAE